MTAVTENGISPVPSCLEPAHNEDDMMGESRDAHRRLTLIA
jgi:hypothetical protein